MNRPEGISAEAYGEYGEVSDVIATFCNNHHLWGMLGADGVAELQAAFDRAIQSSVEAERERAARLAETYAANMSIWMSSEWPTAKLSANYAGQDIARAIRKAPHP